MPLLLDTAESASLHAVRGASCVDVGLINNMPDSALEATERQFSDLIRAGSRDTVVRLLLFAIPEVPRGDVARRDMAGRYRDIAELWDTQLDGLIVTGNEPKSKALKDEPYWPALAQVIDWARANTYSTIWSCLAAHAAVFASDGIERRPFAEKLSGIFTCAPAETHPMMRGVSLPIAVPHSRNNDLPEQDLKAAGYRILTRAPVAGVDAFARQEGSFHLFFQGHPEYDPATLLREYRRDIGRYLRGERDHYPAMPQGYFDTEATAWAEAFREQAVAERHGDLIKNFPMRALGAGLAGGWGSAASAIYANWFEYLKGRKAEQRSPLSLMRRSWRDWPLGAARIDADPAATAR
jgi:homoserine O-succinyltransferase/O-acetyltransferase